MYPSPKWHSLLKALNQRALVDLWKCNCKDLPSLGDTAKFWLWWITKAIYHCKKSATVVKHVRKKSQTASLLSKELLKRNFQLRLQSHGTPKGGKMRALSTPKICETKRKNRMWLTFSDAEEDPKALWRSISGKHTENQGSFCTELCCFALLSTLITTEKIHSNVVTD